MYIDIYLTIKSIYCRCLSGPISYILSFEDSLIKFIVFVLFILLSSKNPNLCCLVDMHLYSNKLSTIAITFPIIKLELFPVCSSCSNIFNLLHNQLGLDDKNLIFEKDFFFWDDKTPEADTIIPGDLSNLMTDLSLVLLLPKALSSKYISFAKSNIIFCPKI